jgi:TolA-binding protein
MKYSAISVAFTVLVPLLLHSAEPSAFGAGDLDSSSPYGLTSTEKVILQNKTKLNTVVVKSKNQANEVDSLRERIDGLQGIIESLSRQAHNNKVTLKKIQTSNDENLHNSDEYSRRLSSIVDKNVVDIQKTQKLIAQLFELTNEIENNYISKKEFNDLVASFNSFKSLVAKELAHGHTTKKSKSSQSSVDLYNSAKAFYDKKYYTKAIKNYETLISRNYKPAYANYMIGEMNYKRRNYANAITYFKTSASLYSKASYMPRLMLHTAISMQKSSDTKHAKVFFNAIISKYPKTKEAQEAKKYLNI